VKKVLIYGLNFAPELTGIGKYSGEMAEYFAHSGMDCSVVTGVPYYPRWELESGYQNCYGEEISPSGVKVFRCPLWIPKKPKAWSRIFHLFTFAFSSVPALWRCRKWKPDVVIFVVPTLFSAPLGLLISRWMGAKTWLHIQDLEVDAMLKMFLKGKHSKISKYVQFFESRLMKRFDVISSISRRMVEITSMKTAREDVVLFPNWSDLSTLEGRGDRDYRREWGLDSADVVVLYSGNLGKKQNLDMLFDVAGELKDFENLYFIVAGAGALKGHLESRLKDENISNLKMLELQPLQDLGDFLRSADLHLVLQSRDVADLVMPSKWTNILGIGGQSLVTAELGTEVGNVTAENPGIALRVEPDDAAALKAGLLQFYEAFSKGGLKKFNPLAHRYAKEVLARDGILDRVVERIEQL
jgi:colanic acid biosynthesis glycosyl transferase WcaI